MGLVRFIRHLVIDQWAVRVAFPKRVLKSIEHAIGVQEQRHEGELRFVVEAALPFLDLIRNISPRDRAIEFFSRLRVWDTESNCGVLIYLLLADRHVEIVADRGIHSKVNPATWEMICGGMQRDFSAGEFERGVLAGVQAISDLLATHYPSRGQNPDELPNAPVVV